MSLDADIVVIATGGLPQNMAIDEGAELAHSAWEILSGDIKPAEDVLLFDDNGAHHVYRQRHRSRMVFPQEMRSLVELAGGLELVDWYYGFKPHLRMDKARHPLLMVAVLRKQ